MITRDGRASRVTWPIVPAFDVVGRATTDADVIA